MIEKGDFGDDRAHFRRREDNRQFEYRRGTSKFQFSGPGALQGFLPEELDGTQSLGGALAGKVPLALEIDEILAEFLGTDQLG